MSTSERPKRNLEAGDLGLPERNLCSVEVGEQVWIIHKNRYNANNQTKNLTEITHIDNKGRLFICMDTAKDLMANWRYGFNPDTGEPSSSYHYQGSRLVYATPEEVTAEMKRLAGIKREQERQYEADRQLALVREAAPGLLEVCKSLALLSDDAELIEYPLKVRFRAVILMAEQAIARAEGRVKP